MYFTHEYKLTYTYTCLNTYVSKQEVISDNRVFVL